MVAMLLLAAVACRDADDATVHTAETAPEGGTAMACDPTTSTPMCVGALEDLCSAWVSLDRRCPTQAELREPFDDPILTYDSPAYYGWSCAESGTHTCCGSWYEGVAYYFGADGLTLLGARYAFDTNEFCGGTAYSMCYGNCTDAG